MCKTYIEGVDGGAKVVDELGTVAHGAEKVALSVELTQAGRNHECERNKTQLWI
jgi:hypothetical protein